MCGLQINVKGSAEESGLPRACEILEVFGVAEVTTSQFRWTVPRSESISGLLPGICVLLGTHLNVPEVRAVS